MYSILCLLAAGAAQAARSPAARALELLRTGHSKEAVEVLQAQLARDPRSAQLATDLGYALARLGRDAEAEAAFQRAIELDPRRWYAYANLASLRTSRRAGGLPPAERDELVLLLERGLSWQGKPGGDPAAKALAKGGLLVALADVERAAGNATAARARLSEARPLPLTTALERRAQAVEQALQGEAQAGRSAEEEAWPEPAVAPGEQSALEAAGARLPADAAGALQDAERLSLAHPSWRGARWLQARALLALGRLDDAARALSALLRLDPAHAAAWRALGETLAEHGGQFESERADEALRHALALEPGWSELWLVRGRLLLRRGRPAEALRALERLSAEVKARGAKGPAELEALLAAARAQAQGAAQGAEGPRAPPEPTAEARALLREAQEAAARGELGPALEKASQACALSPALVEAAALRWSLGGPAPDEAARLFWDDPPGLSRLIDAVRAAGVQQALRAAEAPAEPPLDPSRPGEPPRPPPPEVLPDGGVAIAPPPLPDAAAQAALVRPWIERAASLGEPSALLFRARLRADAQDRAGALEDLGALVALGGPLPLLEEARAMRALLPVQGGPEAPAADPQAAHLRALLAAGKSAEALAGAQGCEGPEAPQEPARLLALGVAHDFAGELAEALACYRASLRRAPGEPVALARLSRAAARAPLAALEPLSADLALAARAGWPAAFLAQARVLEGAGQTAAALAAVQQFFAQPPREGAAPAGLLPPGVDEPGTADARALRQRLLVAQAAAGEARRNRALGLAALGLCALGAAFLLWLRGLTVAAALRRAPALFPAVARAVAELRHDALKHRASALAMLDEAPRADVAAALLGSRPASLLVEDAWHSLRTAAEGRGLSLRPLSREPVFGPLLRDLRRAEQQLARPAGPRDARVRAVAGRLKEHGERLSALLKLGPRTRLDAALVSGWIRAVEAELRSRALPWASVSLELQGLDLDFPVAAAPLQAVLTNLLRNAQAAAAQGQEPRVLVRVAEERDAAGRRVLRLDVGDSSAQPLSLEQIESRESGRGLSLVRDAVRDWQGHLALRAESPPFHKSVSACFPVPRP